MNRLENAVALITGAAQGIGRALARGYAAEGAHAIVADINLPQAEAVAAEIRAEGGLASARFMDLGDPPSIFAAVDETVAELGRIDTLVNNAAVFSAMRVGPFESITAEEWDQVMAVNVRGTFMACQAVSPHMRSRQSGSIINIGAAMVLHGRRNFAHYVTGKAALLGMTRTLATELGDDFVRVNVLMPGGTKTEIARRLTPEQEARLMENQAIHRWGTPDDLLGAAVFLASQESSFITGQVLTVDGGHDYY